MDPAAFARIAPLLPAATRFNVTRTDWSSGDVAWEIFAEFPGGAWGRWCGSSLDDAIARMRGARRGGRKAA